MGNSNAPVSNSSHPVKKYKDINESEISEESIPDFYKSDVIYSNYAPNTNTEELNNNPSPDEHFLNETNENDLEASTKVTEENTQDQDLEKETGNEYIPKHKSRQEQDPEKNIENEYVPYNEHHPNQCQGQDLEMNAENEYVPKHESHLVQEQDSEKNTENGHIPKHESCLSQEQSITLDQHKPETEMIKQPQQKSKLGNDELYARNNYIYNDGNINGICTSQIDYSEQHFNNSECEQETNDFNDCSNIDYHNSALFSEEIPINQE